MLIETAAYASRWRPVAPTAKALFALCGIGAAWIAHRPPMLAALACLLAVSALLLARVPLRTYLALAMAPIGFLLLSCVAMLAAVDASGNWGWHGASPELVARTALRSLTVLAALLGLVLTTPMPDLIQLLRRVRTPELLLDLMVLCYRMLFVLRQAWDDGVQAQRARLGYRGFAHAWRSMGLLAGQMAVQVWQRASALQMAADARGYSGALRFLPAVFPQARAQTMRAAFAGLLLLALATGDRLW